MPLLILFIFCTYFMLLYIYIFSPTLIDYPSNELVYDRTGFLKHFQMQLQSIRAHVMLEVHVQVYAICEHLGAAIL